VCGCESAPTLVIVESTCSELEKVGKIYVSICVNSYLLVTSGSRDSSVSIVSDYRLDGQAIEVPSPAEAKGYFLQNSVSRPALGPTPSCPTDTGNPFPGGKARPGRDFDHSPHLVPRS
jgi:hypothetical protein